MAVLLKVKMHAGKKTPEAHLLQTLGQMKFNLFLFHSFPRLCKLFASCFRNSHTYTSNVPEPPPDFDGLLLSQAFNNASQAQFSLTQLNLSQQAASRNKRHSGKCLNFKLKPKNNRDKSHRNNIKIWHCNVAK